jgi:hypothetical protein
MSSLSLSLSLLSAGGCAEARCGGPKREVAVGRAAGLRVGAGVGAEESESEEAGADAGARRKASSAGEEPSSSLLAAAARGAREGAGAGAASASESESESEKSAEESPEDSWALSWASSAASSSSSSSSYCSSSSRHTGPEDRPSFSTPRAARRRGVVSMLAMSGRISRVCAMGEPVEESLMRRRRLSTEEGSSKWEAGIERVPPEALLRAAFFPLDAREAEVRVGFVAACSCWSRSYNSIMRCIISGGIGYEYKG